MKLDMRILVVEDDPVIAKNVSILLSPKYKVDIAETVEDALIALSSEDFDAAIIDWMLPDGTGIEIIRELRIQELYLPVLMLTARSDVDDIVRALEIGADDYLVKPFRSKELLARVSTLLRRKDTSMHKEVYTLGELTLDIKNRTLFSNDSEIILSPREFDLLEYLYRNLNTPVDRLTLLAHVWGGSIDELSNTVDVHIRYLRKKLGNSSELIKTVKGVGYKLCDPNQKA